MTVKPMTYALTNCTVYTGEEVLPDAAIIIRGSKIETIVSASKIPHNIPSYDLTGLIVAPGFIDIQVNGGGGYLFNNNLSLQVVKKIAEAHRRYGTTNMFVTLLTTSFEKMSKAVDVMEECVRGGMSSVLGVHLEGPYLHPRKAGVHDKQYIRRPDEEELCRLIEKDSLKTIRMMTVAPEMFEDRHLALLVKHGVILSAGHSMATYEQSVRAFSRGIQCVTHLFNAMSQFGSREPGLVGAWLAHGRGVYAGIIADGYHVHPTAIRIAKQLSDRKLFLVTDGTPPVGAIHRPFRLGNYTVISEKGKCVTQDGTLAGTALDMASAVRYCITEVKIPMDEALRMASTYVSELIGTDERLGKIKSSYDANIVIFDDAIDVKAVVFEGELQIFDSAR
ncbi:N-acetylglucosamine-6-phosphate deacetylase [Heliobacillus mobilis]|uniref:N-acetylglucosamine-6-phosphate deacetylase n=1 Tax=Heliobacterium mobile TaxID=28064 RepID=A0A6I3SLZ0_HELMO|nr:N-acetylglucosamine-6-phosphate deacetylase [Heliobacterium mobile]MTV49786.1 N-acetylglucosamine-6-phosphate deacetylase [Heliobacterium mobile]